MQIQKIIRQVTVGMFCLFSVNNTFAQWPQWRGTMRDGLSTESNLLKIWPVDGPKLLWSVNSVGDGFSSAAIQDQVVYTIGKRDSVEILTAIDLSGHVKWQKLIGRASKDKDWPQSRTTPTVYKNKVYVVTGLGDIACFDCKSGNLEWQMAAYEKFRGEGGIAESPLLFDNKLIITPGGNKTTMVALNRLTGEKIWESESIKDTSNFTSPVLLFVNNNEKAIFTSTLHYDLIINGNSGEIKWMDHHISGIVPLINKNQIYFTGENGGTLCSWNSGWTTRTIMWKDSVAGNLMAGAVLFRDKIIVSGKEKGIFCLDPKTGDILSQYKNINYCNLLVADDMLYNYEDKLGRVCLFKMNMNNLELVSSFKITTGNGPRLAHLALCDGLLFIRRGEILMAYDIRH